MRKNLRTPFIALAIALLASIAFSQYGTASAQEVPPAGIVIDYVPGESLTIVDQQGNQHEYELSASLRILPPGRANSLGVGSFVTVIAPASLDQGKQIAVGIVVHPHIPNGWTVPSLSPTPLATGTMAGTETATATATATDTLLATETATATPTATDTPPGTETATATTTATATPTAVGLDTATPTPISGGVTVPSNTLVEWLRSLFQQLLTRQ